MWKSPLKRFTILSAAMLASCTILVNSPIALAQTQNSPSPRQGVAKGGQPHSRQPSTAKMRSGSARHIKHVIYIITDNIHLSDIKQMPHVMKFLHHGTLFKNDHTILDSHTQDGMLSDMTGKYPSSTGVPDQSFFAAGKHVSFNYWTDKDPDGQPHVTTTGPWKTFNQHGWNVGAVGAPDMVLENNGEVQNLNPADTNKADYLGVSVHNTNGSATFGSPNLPYIYNAASWSNKGKTLGGFPGYGSQSPYWPLQATYEMQTHNVPVTFTYMHDVHQVGWNQVGPGQYQSVLNEYDRAFTEFFQKLAKAGINKNNTLFVFTTDEGDHYMPNGERTTNLKAWLTDNPIYDTSANNLNIVSDSGALVYLKNQAHLDQTLSSLKAVPGWNYIANPTELKTLHIADAKAPTRTPSFILFGKNDVYYLTSGSKGWSSDTNYLWNHGTISPDIMSTWLAMVGPGVKTEHVSKQWLDHTNTMPTMYALLGYNLKGHGFAGVPAVDGIRSADLPKSLHKLTTKGYQRLENFYMQLNAPAGKFGMKTLQMSTKASVNATNWRGKIINREIAAMTNKRNRIAKHLQSLLLDAWGNHKGTRKVNQTVHQAKQTFPFLHSSTRQ